MIDRMLGRWTDEYGFLTFASDHGLYKRCTAHGNGDSGLYPGSASPHHGARFSIEIHDNWRYGTFQFWVPAELRGEDDPDEQFDTSRFNRYVENRMGLSARGRARPNGLDLWWDEEGPATAGRPTAHRGG